MDHVFAPTILSTFLLRMHLTSHTCSGLNIDYKIKFSVSIFCFVQNLNFCQFGHVLDHVLPLLVRMHRESHKTTRVFNLTPDLNSLCQISYRFGRLDHIFRFFRQLSTAHVQKQP